METNLGTARSWGAKDIMHGHQYSITKSLIIISSLHFLVDSVCMVHQTLTFILAIDG